ncbi:MAG: hypothetical protein Q7R22_000700 [Verrucomicrobiota bacterium JB025]|nr:hypothetical protein [Verrucomicrobiota bacterium JB025]
MKSKPGKLLVMSTFLLAAGNAPAQDQANIPIGDGGTILGAGVNKDISGSLTAETGNMYSIANTADVIGMEYFTYSSIAAGGSLPETIQPGTYALTLRVGDIGAAEFPGLNDLSTATNTDPGVVAGFFTTLGTNADTHLRAQESKNQMFTEFNAVAGVSYGAPVEADPGDAEWTTWTFRWTVASGSAVVGSDPYFAVYGHSRQVKA